MYRLNEDNVDKYGSSVFFPINFILRDTYRKTYLSIFLRKVIQEIMNKPDIGIRSADHLVFDIQTY